MHKDELLQLHSLLCQVKRFFGESGLDAQGAFDDYEDLEVSPQHIHKSKTDHKKAVFLLGKGLSDMVMGDDPEHKARLIERFQRLAEGKNGFGDLAQRASEQPQAPRTEATHDTEHLPAFALAALSHS